MATEYVPTFLLPGFWDDTSGASSATSSSIEPVGTWQPAPVEPGPCQGCRQYDRCAAGEACAAFALFVDFGGRRWQQAPRMPDRETFGRLFPEDAERQRAA